MDKCLLTNDQLLKSLKENKRDLLVTLGAGDIDKLVNPIKLICQ
jgi:UDP-N-acetylmuramate-alanine ligase